MFQKITIPDTAQPNPAQPDTGRRRLLLAGGALLLCPAAAWGGAQREETLADDVASVMRGSLESVNPARLVFADAREGERWLKAMSARLAKYVPDEAERRRLLVNIQYESSRAGLDTQMVLGLIEVESAFRQYAISGVGARGLMQVMPFWKKYIGKPAHNLFDIRTNLRYGCTILRHYNNVEKGNLTRALARYNGSLGSNKYPNAVFGAWRNRWQWG
ncbi:lytic transglycosylase domain-containing protein [Bergeriella denitrificans]|uniref:Transglycosylase n=1 Tax=Bergeriella denitrificans TaxID=494 RepID=A0A378UF83_BERDE|nr:lytic transglycosylase domain-containing protein [Bergeriella denitrificans]STZ75987.1 transglycosylase [Bergeriella denitrificans]